MGWFHVQTLAPFLIIDIATNLGIPTTTGMYTIIGYNQEHDASIIGKPIHRRGILPAELGFTISLEAEFCIREQKISKKSAKNQQKSAKISKNQQKSAKISKIFALQPP